VTYAIVQTGGKQFRITEGEVVRVPALRADVGNTVELPVLAVTDGETVKLGRPSVEGAHAVCKVVQQGKERKVLVFKFKPCRQYRRRAGHRQKFTALKVEKIVC
jgi:large subunit ribosomal protein L21